MSDMSDDIFTNDGPKNPWSKGGSSGSGRGSSGGGQGGGHGGGRGGGYGGGHGGGPDFDIDELLRRTRDNFGGGFNFSRNIVVLAVLVVLGIWMSSGIYRVQPGEHAVIQRFGEYNRTQEEPGLGYHMPVPIESVQKVNVTLDRRINIGFQEANISRRGGMQKRDIPEESLMLTSDANIVDIDVVVLWNIAEAYKFLFNIRDQEDTLKKSAESVLREVVGQTNLQPIITEGRNEVAERIKLKLQETMDSYGSGISVKQVLIQDATVHPDVIEAFDDVVAAIQDAEKFQNEATIYRNDIIPKARGEAIKMIQEAEGYKQSQVAKATGESQRFNEVYNAYLLGKDVTKERIYIETMEEVLRQARKVIIDQEQGSQGVLPYLPLDNASRSPVRRNATQ